MYHLRLLSLLGLLVMIGLAWLLSEDRRKVDKRLVLWALALQFGFGILLLRTPLRKHAFLWMDKAVGILTDATLEGARVVFGDLVDNLNIGALFAFRALPVIVFVSALAAVLYHLRVIQAVVHGLAWLMRRTLKTSGAETLGATLLIFLGIESVTAIRGYLKDMTRSELCTVMTTFMATIAGSVMVLYASFGAEPGHLAAASLMSAPAAILISKLMVPETAEPATKGSVKVRIPVDSRNIIDAASRGTSEGLMLALNVGAMLITFIGLVYLADIFLNALTGHAFKEIIGWLFSPFALLLGVPTADALAVSQLLGTKSVLNELLAYRDLQQLTGLSDRARTIATYALCGFANPGSLGILIAGLTSLVPERRREIAELGLKSFIGGTLACFSTACIAGVLVNA